MTPSAVAARSAMSEAPSLRSFLAELPDDEVLRITDPIDLDFLPTALVLELEKLHRDPVVIIERPKGSTFPVVTNLFASRDRIAAWRVLAPAGSTTPGRRHSPI